MATEHTTLDPTGTSTGALALPAEPDTTAQSMTASVLEALKDTDLVKRKPGRPKKQPQPQPEEEDDTLPPQKLMASADDDEPKSEAEDEPEQPADDTEVVDEQEPADLEGQLTALADELGVDHSLFADAESVGEARRIFQKLTGLQYAFGAQQEPQYAQQRDSLPAARKAVQTPEDDDAETDLADLDDDEPIKKVLQKRIERERALKAELRELKEQHRRSEEAEAIRVQQQVVQELHNEFYRIAPDLFGDGKKQTVEQRNKLNHAISLADVIVRGAVQNPNSPLRTIRSIAAAAVNAGFHEELANKKILAKREQVQQRQQRRAVGPPARQSRAPAPPPGKHFDGPLSEDPNLIAAVSKSMRRVRTGE